MNINRAFCAQLRQVRLRHTMANPLIPTEMLLSAWLRHHLFILGFDKLKLHAYKKLSSLISQGGGGVIKNVVFDMSLFVKREWNNNLDLLQHVAPDLTLNLNMLDFKWFYISVGYMMLTQPESKVELLTDKVVNFYLDLGGGHLLLDAPIGNTEKQILKLAAKYYKSVKINYRALYDPNLDPRFITVGEGTSAVTICLPDLPKINSKHLLAKALLHKELYRAVFLVDHPFCQSLMRQNISINRSALNVIRYDLLFLDGLGDFFLATESSEFLYKFRSLKPYSEDASFGKKTYTLLKTILATNTLLLRLAVAYNLHTALDDNIVSGLLNDSYIPYISSGMVSNDPLVMKYEEEFVADYFEQYVGALYLEQPEVAKEWINILFERILFLISDSYKVIHRRRKLLASHYDYRAWSVDVIGRSI
ncbi:CIC11C00000001770 [Sungouiella intermedia]|uniref:CIC11C00000001770 n=1 Tax=Sungouiella intermedia TaxID=45354 RepID=A0A1L0C1U2_9ASCO|nr:CIC11C00000001770 [[Candida] intermedia]